MKRLEHAIPAGIISLVGIWVAWVSFTQTPAEAFAFPRLVSTIFVVLALWTFVRALLVEEEGEPTISLAAWGRILPGLAIAIVYVFWAAKGLGFYTATALAVFALVSIYDAAPHGALSSWARRVAITAGFVLVMYLLFASLLGVFTPREVLFR